MASTENETFKTAATEPVASEVSPTDSNVQESAEAEVVIPSGKLCAHATPFAFCSHCANSTFISDGEFQETSEQQDLISATKAGSENPVPLQLAVRITGGEFPVFDTGCCQFSLGLAVYYYLDGSYYSSFVFTDKNVGNKPNQRDHTNVKLGAWWAGVVIIVAALLALASNNRFVVSACSIMSFIGIGFGIIGIFRDEIGYDHVKTLATCVHGPTTLSSINGTLTYSATIYGQNSHAADATSCYLYEFAKGYDCDCVSSKGGCFYYNGLSDCNNVLSEYPKLLEAITALDVTATVFVFFLSILTCVSLCSAATATSDASADEDADQSAAPDSSVRMCAHVIPFIYCPVCQAKLDAAAAAASEQSSKTTCSHAIPFIYCTVCQAKLAASEKEVAEKEASDTTAADSTVVAADLPVGADIKEEPTKDFRPEKDAPPEPVKDAHPESNN